LFKIIGAVPKSNEVWFLEIMRSKVEEKEIPKVVVAPCEGVFDVLVRFMRADAPPLPLLELALRLCAALLPAFPAEIHLRYLSLIYNKTQISLNSKT
jgi:hypothetical protein